MVGGRHTLSARGTTRSRGRANRGTDLLVLLASVVVVGILVAMFTVRGTRILTLRNQLSSSLRGHEEALVERQDLENRLAMRNDLAAIEDAAREDLGWVMPGEERVIFVDWTEESADEGD